MSTNKPKCFEVINNTDKHIKSITVGGRRVKFKRNGTAMVDDPGVAREIEQRFGPKAKGHEGGKVVVAPLEAYNERRDRQVKRVNYMTSPGMPWHIYDELGRVVGRKENKHE